MIIIGSRVFKVREIFPPTLRTLSIVNETFLVPFSLLLLCLMCIHERRTWATGAAWGG